MPNISTLGDNSTAAGCNSRLITKLFRLFIVQTVRRLPSGWAVWISVFEFLVGGVNFALLHFTLLTQQFKIQMQCVQCVSFCTVKPFLVHLLAICNVTSPVVHSVWKQLTWLYIGCSYVRESMATIRSSFCGYNSAYCVELKRKDLLSYSHKKIEAVTLRNQ